MPTVDYLCDQLREHGRRVTPQRRAIIQVLTETSGTHPTAEQIFTSVRDTMPDMSHATVYNTLHELVEMGLLLELGLGLREHRYDINVTEHAHLVCLKCGRVEDVPCDCDAVTLSPEQARGFLLVERDVVFRGYCPDCNETMNNGAMG